MSWLNINTNASVVLLSSVQQWKYINNKWTLLWHIVVSYLLARHNGIVRKHTTIVVEIKVASQEKHMFFFFWTPLAQRAIRSKYFYSFKYKHFILFPASDALNNPNILVDLNVVEWFFCGDCCRSSSLCGICVKNRQNLRSKKYLDNANFNENSRVVVSQMVRTLSITHWSRGLRGSAAMLTTKRLVGVAPKGNMGIM